MQRKIFCVTPTIRPESIERFKQEWERLFLINNVTLMLVWDGEKPRIEIPSTGETWDAAENIPEKYHDVFCRFTDAVRNYGFVHALRRGATHILSLDDDCYPLPGTDPIKEHLDTLDKKVSSRHLNTAMEYKSPGDPLSKEMIYLRGYPYFARDTHPVVFSHGVWYNIPDLDGETQLRLTANGTNASKLPYALPFYEGPIPSGVFMPICGMNIMFRREIAGSVYFAPMGPDSGFPNLHRFADIWMGVNLLDDLKGKGQAVYTGVAPIRHSRLSDAHKNFEAEKLGRKWNEYLWRMNEPCNNDEERRLEQEMWADKEFGAYYTSYTDKNLKYKGLVSTIINPAK